MPTSNLRDGAREGETRDQNVDLGVFQTEGLLEFGK